MLKMLVVGALVTVYMPVSFYFVFDWVRKNRTYFENALGPISNEWMLGFTFIIIGVSLCVFAWAVGKTKYAVNTGSAHIAISSMAIVASMFIKPSLLWPYLPLMLFILAFGYAILGGIEAVSCVNAFRKTEYKEDAGWEEKNKFMKSKKIAWCFIAGELVLMTLSTALIFSVLTFQPVK